MSGPTVCVIAGGVGAAKLLAGIVRVVDPAATTAVVNVGDDLVLHGLHISPDLDTITYTLAGRNDTATGWGLAGETWNAMETLGRYGGADWFSLGDHDLGTHLYRTQRLHEGARLSEVTGEITRSWGLALEVLPATDDELRTMITLAEPADETPEVAFQEYFVRLRHEVAVTGVRFAGAGDARPSPGVLDAIRRSDVVVVAPSNPIVSIGPVLAVPGIREALEARRDDVVAVSPLIAGRALKGPADRLMRELGHEATATGVARIYSAFAGTIVIDEEDASLAGEIAASGVRPVVAPTVMTDPSTAASLARTVLGCDR